MRSFSTVLLQHSRVSEAQKPNHWHLEQAEGERRCLWIKGACCHHKKKGHAVREGPSYVKQRFKYCGRHASCGTVSALSGCKHLSRLINRAGETYIMSEATLTCTRGAASSGAWSPDSRFRVYAQIFPCLKAQKDWLPVSYSLWIRRIGFMRNLTTYSGGPDAQLRLYCIQNGFVKAGWCNLSWRLVKAELGRWGKVCMKAD